MRARQGIGIESLSSASFRLVAGALGLAFASATLVASSIGCGGKQDTASTPTPDPTETSTPVPTSSPSGFEPPAFASVTCKPGTNVVAKFAGERPLSLAVTSRGVLVAATLDAAGKSHVRLMRDAAKGFEAVGDGDGVNTRVATFGTNIVYTSANTLELVVAETLGKREMALPKALGAGPHLVALSSENVFVSGEGGLFAQTLRQSLQDTPEPVAVCVGDDCRGVPGALAARGVTVAATVGDKLYAGTVKGLSPVASGARAKIALGTDFIGFSAPNGPDGSARPFLGMYRPLESDTQLVALAPGKGSTCTETEVSVRALATDGTRLAVLTQETCGTPRVVLRASRASQPTSLAEVGSAPLAADGAVAVAADETCVYLFPEGKDASGSAEAVLTSYELHAH